MNSKVKFTFAITFLFALLIFFLWKARNEADSEPLEPQPTALSSQQKKFPHPLPPAKNGGNVSSTTKKVPPPPQGVGNASDTEAEEVDELDQKIDINFETWLLNYGQALDSFEIMSYFYTPLSAQQKNRLLDFWFYETAGGYEYLNTAQGMEFLNTLLANNPKNINLAKRIGFIMNSYSRINDNKLNEEAEDRFSKSKNESEKVAMLAISSDEKFLRTVIYDHRESTSVRAAAVNSFLATNKEPGEFKRLLELSETQPKLQDKVISSAITSAGVEDLDDIFSVLKDQGLGKDATAILIGKTLANNGRMDLIKGLEDNRAAFQRKIKEAFDIRNKEIGVRYGYQ